MPLVTPKSSSHWYFPNGEACHSVPMKSRKGEMRNTTLGDARKMGLYPSVTNIIGVLAQPQLEAWKIEQGILAALTLPVIEGESVDDRAKRVVRDSMEQVDEARKRGHLCHKCIEDYLTTGLWEPHDSVEELMRPFKGWVDGNVQNVVASECTLVGKGYAGRTDLIGYVKGISGRCILDFKTRKPSQGKLRTYDEDCLQLSAYKMAYNWGNVTKTNFEPAVNTLSIIINSQEIELPTVHAWSMEDQDRYGTAFLNCFNLWKLLKGYNPETGESI